MLPADRSWVDHAAGGPVTLVRTPGGVRTEALEQLFWNPSIDRVAVLPGAIRLDAFQADKVSVAADGRNRRGRRAPARDPRLVGRAAGGPPGGVDRGLRPVATHHQAAPVPAARRALRGRLARAGRPDRGLARTAGRPVAGRLRLDLSAPDAVREMTFSFSSAGRRTVEAVVPGGTTREVVLTVCSSAPWRGRFEADQAGFVGSRMVSGRSSAPVFTPDARACAPAKAPATTL